ncbi:hypothetical protein [Flavobacterium sp.]|uniref:hypothetical protein n=1 Tax=Flavobacterium sp. TaxID=239 RepID=UPI00261A3AE0|nr:hypothetical protein [Flavobacterium sp.]
MNAVRYYIVYDKQSVIEQRIQNATADTALIMANITFDILHSIQETDARACLVCVNNVAPALQLTVDIYLSGIPVEGEQINWMAMRNRLLLVPPAFADAIGRHKQHQALTT